MMSVCVCEWVWVSVSVCVCERERDKEEWYQDKRNRKGEIWDWVGSRWWERDVVLIWCKWDKKKSGRE